MMTSRPHIAVRRSGMKNQWITKVIWAIITIQTSLTGQCIYIIIIMHIGGSRGCPGVPPPPFTIVQSLDVMG